MNLFSKIVFDKVKKEYAITLNELDDKNSKLMSELMVELERKKTDYESKMKKHTEEEKRKMISKAKGQAKKNILLKKEEIRTKLKKVVVDKINEKCSSGEYCKLIIEENIDELLELKGEINIICKDNDEKRVEKFLKSNGIKNDLIFTFDENILGGFIVIDDGKGIKLDFTINSIIDENEIYMGSLIDELFKKAGETNE